MKLLLRYTMKYKKYFILNIIGIFGFILIQLGLPTVYEQIINNVVPTKANPAGNKDLLMPIIIVMIVFVIVGFIGQILMSYSNSKIAANVVRDIRNDVYKQIQTFSHHEFNQFGVSALTTAISSDAYQILLFLNMVLKSGVLAPFMIVSSFVMILSKNTKLAVVVLIAIPILVAGMLFIGLKSKPYSLKQQQGLDKINLKFRENLTGLRVIRAFGNEDYQSDKFEEVNKEYSEVSKGLFRLTSIATPGFSIIFSMVIVTVVLIGTNLVSNTSIQVGTLNSFIEYIFHVLFSFMMFAVLIIMYPRASVSVSRMKAILDTEPTIINKENAISDGRIEGRIKFNDVTFAYPDSEEPVLENITFEANPGETVAFIGSTGSGKSTLIQLIPRFYDVTSGSITIDDVDLRDYELEHLRDNIGYTPQKALLFTGSILDNIKYSNKDLTMEEVEKAADIAQAKDFIYSKEERYETFLAEGGENLSGGQRQRLSIARSIAKNAPILVFDDSFSALDYQTDKNLRAKIAQEITDTTILIVAQRVGTIIDADKIVVLDEGKIVGIGTHRELLKNCEIYYAIASSQLSEEELE